MAPWTKCLLYKLEDPRSLRSTHIQSGPSKGVRRAVQRQEDAWRSLNPRFTGVRVSKKKWKGLGSWLSR